MPTFDPLEVCPIAELDRVLAPSNPYTVVEKTHALGVAVGAFEQEANQAFSPRQITETTTVRYSGELVLGNFDIRSIDEIEGYSGDVEELVIDDDMILGNWSPGRYKVTYTFGLSPAPLYIQRAIALIASSIIADGPFDDRGYAVDDGTGLVRLLTAGVNRASFSIPEVQAALNRCRNPWVGGA